MAKETLIAELLEIYWQPVYVLARRKGLDVDAAKDAVQGLFLQLLERDFTAKIAPAKGRLRSYLRSAMAHYLADQFQKRGAEKRGGKYRLESLDTVWADRTLASTSELSPEEAYERTWAQLVMERAFKRLQQEYASGARTGPFEAIVESFRGDARGGQQDVASRHNMSVSQLKSFLFRARNRLKELVAEEVGGTLVEANEIESEVTAIETLVGQT